MALHTETAAYNQPDCHLCDEAESLLLSAGLLDHCESVDIETDLELLKSYGIHVPVLKRKDNEMELYWPFDLDQLQLFANGQN